MAKVEHLDIQDVYDHCLETWGPASLPELTKIKVTLEPFMTRALGRAMPPVFKRHNKMVRRDYYSLTFSRPWLAALAKLCGEEVTKAQFRDVVIHELAHIACFHTYPQFNIGHGFAWQEFTEKAGARPTKYFWEHGDDEYVMGSDVTWQEVATFKSENGYGRY